MMSTTTNNKSINQYEKVARDASAHGYPRPCQVSKLGINDENDSRLPEGPPMRLDPSPGENPEPRALVGPDTGIPDPL